MKDERSDMPKVKLPDWLCQSLRRALLGEIYSNIRAIAIAYRNEVVTVKYYLDRQPTSFDKESIEIVATNLDSLESDHKIKNIKTECLFFKGYIRDMEPLDGFFYARREVEE